LVALRKINPAPEKLAASWPALVRSLERRGKAEAEALLATVGSMGILALGDHIEKQPPGPMAIAWLVKLARDQQQSQFGANAAKRKNAEAREWVRSEWLAHRAEGGGFSKIHFARRYSKRIEQQARFNTADGASLMVTPDRIARYWLKD
jgi:hypothetical protein